MMQLVRPLNQRLHKFLMRTVSITPQEISTNIILDDIIADLIIGSTTGFNIEDENLNDARMFLEVSG